MVEWQTRSVQDAMIARSWEFNSPPGHIRNIFVLINKKTEAIQHILMIPTPKNTKTYHGRRPSQHGHERATKQIAPTQEKTEQSSELKLRIIPLGGMEEVGRNMTIFEYGDDILILDMGIQFPEDDMPGINYIIPNVEYLKGKKDKIKAVIFSHAHLDHIGAAPIILEQLGFPTIVARPLTLAFLKRRQYDYKPNTVKNLKTITVENLRNPLTFGKFRLTFFPVEHSVMDAMGVVMETPTATVIHLGDWTLEKNEHNKALVDYSFLSKVKRPTILMSEALGITDIRPSTTAPVMKRNLTNILSHSPGRVIIGTFASQIERVGWIIGAAEKLGKKVAIDGYSMKTNVEISKTLGYIKARKDTLINVGEIDKHPDNKIVIIVTGSQGESNAVFSRVVAGTHHSLRIKKNDTVIFSSSIIPGNEHMIQKLKDRIYRQSENVIHNEIMDIHVSGHANREDNIQMLKQVKPDYYIPTYAWHYMLVEAVKLAREIGFKDKNILLLDDGQVAEFDASGGCVTNKRVPCDQIFVDGIYIGNASSVMLSDRQIMAEEGIMIIVALIDKRSGKLIQDPDIISRGFVYMKESKELTGEIRRRVRQILEKQGTKHHQGGEQENGVKNIVRDEIGDFLYFKTQRRPTIIAIINRI